ncbi:Rieske 2Fe-2S domain-containing protein [Fabibacter sp. E12]|nr:Rieske 2Fe-2S domain-containing protein [Roseivirga sp. E12]
MDKVFVEKDIRVLRIGEQKLCLAKTKKGYFAFEALCPHQKQPLSEGSLNAFSEVICPLHFYRFNLKTGEEANRLCQALKTFPLEINDEGIFIKVY